MKTKLNFLSFLAPLLIGASILPGAALAQKNAGAVGTWFAPEGPNPYVWVFHGDGTLTGFDSAFGGVLTRGPEPMQIGPATSWYGDWKKMKDGSIRGYAIKFGADGPGSKMPGRFSAIFQATINFKPAEGALLFCVEMTNFAGSSYDAKVNDPAKLRQVDTCTADYKGMDVVSMKVRRLAP